MTLLERAKQLITKELSAEERADVAAKLSTEFPDTPVSQLGVVIWKAHRPYETNKPLTEDQVAAIKHVMGE